MDMEHINDSGKPQHFERNRTLLVYHKSQNYLHVREDIFKTDADTTLLKPPTQIGYIKLRYQ
jgi:hypothetical protein